MHKYVPTPPWSIQLSVMPLCGQAALLESVILREDEDPKRTTVGEVLARVEYPQSMRLATHNSVMDALRVVSGHRVSHGLPVYDSAQNLVGYVPVRNLLKAARAPQTLRCSTPRPQAQGPAVLVF